MSGFVNIRQVIKSLIHGSFEHKICFICLLPLDGASEELFTNIGEDYSTARVLEEVCNIKVSHMENYRVCDKCFKLALSSYKFYTTTQRSQEILNFYLEKLQDCLCDINYNRKGPLGITLPKFKPLTKYFDYEIQEFDVQGVQQDKSNSATEGQLKKYNVTNKNYEDDIVLEMDDDGVPSFFKSHNGKLISLNRKEISGFPHVEELPKCKRKRKPMIFKSCTKCPVKYRLLTKLKRHMEVNHGLNVFICRICKIIIENENEYESHLQTHGEVHSCDKCEMVFKRRDAIINHLKWHEQMEQIANSDGTYVCEVCGVVVESVEHLEEHYEKKHVNKFTCFYCGRMYMVQANFEAHIKKHEIINDKLLLLKRKDESRKKKFNCAKCKKGFVDERALLWHSRLHTNERPYPCKICGRAFISVNRRNQHALCAHTAPTRRCPLCPALFHLTSMVNTHIKKVHLKRHKRRHRPSKHQNVYWKTETVPIQELSVAIQDETLELQAKQTEDVFDLI